MSKILFVHHSGLIGGAGVSLVNTIRSVALENEVIVYVSSEPDDMINLIRERCSGYDVKVCTYGRRIGALTYYSGGDSVLSLRFWYRAVLIVLQWKKWNQIIFACNPDVVIVNSKILCWMGLLSEVKKRASICFVRETMKQNRKNSMNCIITKLLDNFSKVIFLSKYDRDKEQLEISKTEVIHNYVEPENLNNLMNSFDAFQLLGLDETKFHVLYVGGVSYMKGFDIAVQSVLESGRDVELIVAGNGFEDTMHSRDKKTVQYACKMKEYIQEHDKYNQIHMLGKQKNMSACYAACDVLIFPMRDPHQSRPAFEAGYFGKPVIISDFENISEFVKDGYNGFLVSSDNEKGFSEKVLWLKANPESLKIMGENNRLNTEQFHNRKKNCYIINNIINGLIK